MLLDNLIPPRVLFDANGSVYEEPEGIYTVLAALPSHVPVTAPVKVNAFGVGNLVGIVGLLFKSL